MKLWQVERDDPVAILPSNGGAVLGVAITADGQQMVSGGEDGTLRLWQTSDASAVQTMRPDRLHERRDVTGVSGLTDAQRQTLFALGAVAHDK